MKDSSYKEEMNHQAYNDVCDCLPPRYPDDPIYMECWEWWRPLQKYPYED